jgi:diaminopimelate decarboxylase
LGARLMVQFLAQVRDELGFTAQELDLGGGLGIRYLPADTPPAMEEYSAQLVGTVEAECEKHGLEVPRLAIEPGRSIAGEAGTTLYTVGHIKHIPGVRTYVAVDGGISDNPRPALYEAQYHAVNASRMNEAASETVTISGKHCETDTLIVDAKIATPQIGDLIAVFSTGAYNYSMASNYNRFRRPAVVLVHDGQSDLIVERETLQDLLTHDLVPERLLVAG